MYKKASFAAILLVLLAAGCSIEGKWTMKDVEPSAAVHDLEFNVITLQKDGTFYADRSEGTGMSPLAGTYRWNNKVLTLTPQVGEAMSYDAELSGDTLNLEKMWNNQKVRIKFQKKESPA